MSGHSKFSNIKHRKTAQDQKRARLFLQISNQIIQAIKQHGPDDQHNPALRLYLQKARAANMPKANIEKIINKFKTGGQVVVDDLYFYGYFRQGVVLLVQCAGTNRKRVTAIVKSSMQRCQVKMGTGSWTKYFFRAGLIKFKLTSVLTEEVILNQLINCPGVQNYDIHEDICIIKTDPRSLSAVQQKVAQLGVTDFLDVVPALLPVQKLTVASDLMGEVANIITFLTQQPDVLAVISNI